MNEEGPRLSLAFSVSRGCVNKGLKARDEASHGIPVLVIRLL